MRKFFRAGVIYSNLALLGAAFIWGVSFVAQKAGMEYVGPFTFNAARTFLGGLSLLPVIAVFKLLSLKNDTGTPEEKFNRHKKPGQKKKIQKAHKHKKIQFKRHKSNVKQKPKHKKNTKFFHRKHNKPAKKHHIHWRNPFKRR